jgi:hypothetical protein
VPRNPNWLDMYPKSLFNLKRLILQSKDVCRVLTAQVDAWAAVHRGELDETAREINTSLADAALAGMILHHRRAVAPQVVDEFFKSAGVRFAPYLGGGLAPSTPLDFAGEMADAKAAAAIAEQACGSKVPLLFERALMAETEGRPQDAAADLDLLLETYPGFVTAALAAGRFALANGDPLRAIEVLTYVQRELVEMREGASLLADVLRAIGMPEAASRYDVAALVGYGYMDSRGNDFAPVDMAGDVVSHHRMLPAFYVDHLPSGQALYNDRGVYYTTNSTISDLLFSIFRTNGTRSARARRRRAPPSKWWILDKLESFNLWLKTDARKLGLAGRIASAAPLAIAEGWRQLAWLRSAIDRSLRRALPQLAAWGLLEIPERDRHSPIVQARLRSGIAAIFAAEIAHLADPLGGQSVSPSVANEATQAAREPMQALDDDMLEAQLARLGQSGALSPMAQQALHRLVGQVENGRNEMASA